MATHSSVIRCRGTDGNTYEVRQGPDGGNESRGDCGDAKAFDSMWTTDGRAVSYVAKGKYHLEGTEIDMVSDDPAAP